MTDLGPCEIWTGPLNEHGYGAASYGLAHRLAWQAANGPVPDGLELDHLCRVRSCVRPDHLEPVTHRENCRRGDAGKHFRDKTHCPRGHPYSGDNLLLSKGARYCRACRKAQQQAARDAAKSVDDPCSICGVPFDAVKSNGTRYCTPCTSARGKANMAKRWHGVPIP